MVNCKAVDNPLGPKNSCTTYRNGKDAPDLTNVTIEVCEYVTNMYNLATAYVNRACTGLYLNLDK